MIGDDFQAHAGSTINIAGGIVGDRFTALAESTANVSGGAFGHGFAVSGDVAFFGTSFLLDGAPIGGLDAVGDSVEVTERNGELLSVLFADGSEAGFGLNSYREEYSVDFFASDATLRLVLLPAIPEPSSLILSSIVAALFSTLACGARGVRCLKRSLRYATAQSPNHSTVRPVVVESAA